MKPRRRPPWLAVALVLLAAGSPAAPPALFAAEPTWDEAGAAGMRIGEVRIACGDVFDLTRPDEAHFLGRAANFIHVTTKERVVRGALLFGPGDAVNPALIRESERRLRALTWIIDATIVPAAASPGVVDALVRTHDGWSLSLNLDYRHVGGDDRWRVWIEEDNLLGLGKQLLVGRAQDLERSTTEFAYKDAFLFGSAWRLELAAQDLSDGSGRRLLLQRPFVRLDGAWSAGVEASRRALTETHFNRAAAVYSFPATLREGRVFASFRFRFENRTAWRAGLEYRVREAAYGDLTVLRPDELPPPRLAERRLRGLLLTWAVAQDRYRAYRNLKSIECTEDLNLGWEASAAAGWAAPALGGGGEALVAECSVKKGGAFGGEAILVGGANGRGRFEDGRARDALGTGYLTLYATGLRYQTLVIDLDAAAGNRLDPESLLYIGGFDGLRGYPNHFRAGESRWLLSVEDRVITPWRIWGIAQAGLVLYAEAGAVSTPAGGWTRTYADLGAGLRFGNLKGTVSRVVSLTFSVPLAREAGLAGWQVIAGDTLHF